MAGLVLDGIRKEFPGGVRAVHDLHLTIADGEFLVLVGPSGCGKTTTLRIIAGLEQASAGTVAIGGRRIDHLPPKDRDLAVVFQNYALYPHLTVRGNLAFGLRIRGTPADEAARRIAQVAEMLEFTHLLERKPGQLSGGQQQRVALGRALVRQPQAYLLDEPLSNLDARLRAQTRVELKQLHARLAATFIYVTHDQVEAMTMADRIVVMHQGTVQQMGAPLEVYRRPANRFVASFLGTPPMNLVRGQVDHGLFSADGIRLPLAAADGPVELGLRPEDLRLAADGPIAGTVAVIEPLGAELLAHVRCGNHTLIVRCDGRATLAPGQDVRLLAHETHLFDATTGARR